MLGVWPPCLFSFHFRRDYPKRSRRSRSIKRVSANMRSPFGAGKEQSAIRNARQRLATVLPCILLSCVRTGASLSARAPDGSNGLFMLSGPLHSVPPPRRSASIPVYSMTGLDSDCGPGLRLATGSNRVRQQTGLFSEEHIRLDTGLSADELHQRQDAAENAVRLAPVSPDGSPVPDALLGHEVRRRNQTVRRHDGAGPDNRLSDRP